MQARPLVCLDLIPDSFGAWGAEALMCCQDFRPVLYCLEKWGCNAVDGNDTSIDLILTGMRVFREVP